MEHIQTLSLIGRLNFFRKVSTQKYGINNQRITQKRLKIGKEIEEEVEALFGPCSCNGYRYCHNEDQAFISRVETLWMIMHQ